MAVKLKDADGNEIEILTLQEQTDMITGAVKAQLGKLSKSLIDDVTKKVSESVTESIGAYEEKRKTESNTDPGDGGGKPAPSIADSPEFKSLARQLQEEKAAREKRDTELKAEREKARAQKLRQDTLEALTTIGFSDAQRAKHALTFLVGEGRVAWDESGEKLLYSDASGDAQLLSDGLKSWSKSDEAKIYLPPRGAGGSGGNAGQPGPRNSGNDSAAEAASALRAVFGIGG